MKYIHLAMVAPVLTCLMGCATASRVTLLEQVGPGPVVASRNADSRFLQVYSARERAPIDVNAEEFFWNSDFGRNEFLHGTAHTSYSIYAPDGHLLQRVRNTTGMNDANPTLVKLSPGLYQVKAEAEDYNDVTLTVLVPVCVKPGLTTTVHLDGLWNPPAGMTEQGDQIVRLPNGNNVGWHSSTSDSVDKLAKTSG